MKHFSLSESSCTTKTPDALQGFPRKRGHLRKVKTHLFSYPGIKNVLLLFRTLRPLHGKGYPVAEKLVGSAVFLKLVRPLVFSDPACAENRVGVVCVEFLWLNSAFGTGAIQK